MADDPRVSIVQVKFTVGEREILNRLVDNWSAEVGDKGAEVRAPAVIRELVLREARARGIEAPRAGFGRRLRMLREYRGLSLEALANAAFTTANYIASVESGLRDPPLSTVLALAYGLKVAPSTLFISDEQLLSKLPSGNLGSPSRSIEFGPTIRRLRKRHGLSLEALADCSALTPNYMGAIENGSRKPSLSTVLALARGLRIEASELFEQATSRAVTSRQRSPRSPA